MIDLTDDQMEMMKNACREEAPREACGLIATGGVCYRLPNQAESPGRFSIRVEDVAEVYNRHGGYEGVWHTHPSGDPTPSEADLLDHPRGTALVIATATQVVVYHGL